VNWLRIPVDPEVLNKLNTTSDFKGWLQAGGHILLTTLTAAGTIAMWYYQQWLWLIPALCLHGMIQGMLGAGVHELVHERVFTTRIYNRFFLALNSFLTTWNYPFFEISHKEHHRFTLNQPHDLEVVLPAVEALAEMKPETNWQALLRWCQHYFAWSAVWSTFKNHWILACGRYPKDGRPGGLWSETWCDYMFGRMTEKERLGVRNWSRWFLLGHVALTVFSLALGWWIVPLVVTFAPFFGGALGFWTGGLQHLRLMDGVNDFRLCCRTYTCSKFVQFLYWNMNYHIEHHMYAAVPCYNLPKLHEQIRDHLPPVHTSLFSAWCEVKQVEFRQLSDPTYRYRQPLPEDGAAVHVEDVTAPDYLTLTEPPKAEPTLVSPEHPEGGWKVWECTVCAFLYDEAEGMPDEGIPPGTRWDDIPDDWACPDCGLAKQDFIMMERVEAA